MEDKEIMIEQLLLEMIIAKENADEELSHQLFLIKEKLEKEIDEEY